MLASYQDILSRIKEHPKWYDENGVPRYDDFKPDLAPDIYCDEVILLEISCQDCGRRFFVEMHWTHLDLMLFRRSIPNPSFSEDIRKWMKEQDKKKIWPPVHFGDPPSHGCVGDTENCFDLRIVQFWEKGKGGKWGWVRKPEFEIELQQEV
jgi:hypothetical protein